MKTTFTSLSVIMILCASAMAYNYNAKYIETAPVIDGTLSSGEWDGVFDSTMTYPAILSDPYNGSSPDGWATPASTADLSVDIYTAWDDDNIYLAFRVYDNDHGWLNYSPGPYNSQDAVQLLFNPGGYSGHYSSAGAAASIIDLVAQTADSAGAGFYGRNDAVFSDDQNIIMDGSVLSDGYVIEVKLVNSAFGVTPALGESIGIGFIFSDADSGAHETLITDTSTDGTWDVNQTTSWNDFVFVGADGCGLYGFAASDLNKDCIVGLDDFTVVASEWLKCTDPTGTGCVTSN
ncbi:MAG: sugar-binding protein [Sedimentisphaeraceae bacterium JB056]